MSGNFGPKKPTAPETAHKPVLTVSVQSPVRVAMSRHIDINGTITAWDPVSVGATAGGLQVNSVRVEEGDLVKRGQILATLDSAQLRAQLDSEQARLAANQASADKSVQPNRQEDINALAAVVSQAEATVADQEAELIQAKANLENANRNIERYEALRKEGAVSTQEAQDRFTVAQVDDATARSAAQRVSAARFALKQAKEKYAMAFTGGRKEDIEVARAAVNESKGNVRRLQTQIEETIIRAPVDGQIVRRDVHIGDISTAGKTMFYMARDNRLELRAQVPDSDLRYIKPKQHVDCHSSYTGDKNVSGTVREISPLVDTDTRLATVRIDVPAGCGLKPGMYVEGRLDIGKYDALAVPSNAVINRDDKHSVFVLHNGQVENRTVVTGNRDNGLIQVDSGLTPTDQIVVEGAGFLKDGDYVAVGK
ncbi:MAG TPA: efflux RND transporter periplasmic adaptor subunit [Planktothrix sp.]|jgi:HlyD family secretion protein